MSSEDRLLLALGMRLWSQRGQLVSWEHLGTDARGHEPTVAALSRLLEMGFDVRLSPAGVRLIPPDDTPCSHEVLSEAGVPTVCAPVIDSTNTIGILLARARAPHGTVVLAEAQLSGRGRHGREWFSPAGQGVWCTVVLRPSMALPHPGLVSLLAGLVVARVLREMAIPAIMLKWTNDVLWRGRKVSGILVDRVVPPEGEVYVVGIGINVHHQEEDFPQDIRGRSVSLAMMGVPHPDRAQLLSGVVGRLLDTWAIHEPAVLSDIPKQWNAESGIVGRTVRAGTERELLVGIVQGVNEQGEIVLDLADGATRAIASGRIELMG